MPKAIAWIGKWGPVKSRILALSLVLTALFFTFNTSFAAWLFTGFGVTTQSAVSIQNGLRWFFAMAGALIWFAAFLFRQPYALLVMDRPKGILNLHEQTFWSVAPKKETVYRFDDVENIEVFAKTREPLTPEGYVRLSFKNLDQKKHKHELAFRFLTAEQFQFFPSNLYKIIGKEPKGDWSEEDPVPELGPKS